MNQDQTIDNQLHQGSNSSGSDEEQDRKSGQRRDIETDQDSDDREQISATPNSLDHMDLSPLALSYRNEKRIMGTSLKGSNLKRECKCGNDLHGTMEELDLAAPQRPLDSEHNQLPQLDKQENDKYRAALNSYNVGPCKRQRDNRRSRHSLALSEKELNDQRLMMEFQLLDAIKNKVDESFSSYSSQAGDRHLTNSDSWSDRRRSRFSSANNQSFNANFNNATFVHNTSDFENAFSGNNVAIFPTTTHTIDEVSENELPTTVHDTNHTDDATSFRSNFTPSNCSQDPLLYEKGIQRRRWFFGIIFVLLGIGAAILASVLVVVHKCEVVGCSRDILYNEITTSLSEGSDFVFSANTLTGYGRLSDLSEFLISTYPRNISYALSTDKWILKINAERNSTSPLLTPPASAMGKNIKNYNGNSIIPLGAPICGRLSHTSPILGLLPTSVGQSNYIDGTNIHGIQISDFDTATGQNEGNQTEPIESELKFSDSDLAVCCIEFFDLQGQNATVKRSQVNAHLVCESGPGFGGVWSGWNSIIDLPPGSWLSSVRTANQLQFGSQVSGESALTTLSLSTQADADWHSGLLVQSKVGVPSDLHPGWKTLLETPVYARNGSTYTFDAVMDAVFPFERNQKYTLNMTDSLIQFGISRENFDISNIVPSPWIDTDGHSGIIRFPYSLSPGVFYVAFGRQFVTFLEGGCPNSYYEFSHHLCWHSSVQLNAKTRIYEDLSFHDDYKINWFGVGKNELMPVTVIESLFSANSDQPLLLGRNSQILKHFTLNMKIRLNDINGTSWTLTPFQVGRFFLMLDGSTHDTRLGDPMLSPLQINLDSSEYKFIDIENRIGGEWVELKFLQGVPRFQPWNDISGVTVKTSGRIGNVVLGFIPSNEFRKQNLDIQVQFSVVELPSLVAVPIEVTVKPETVDKPKIWDNVIRTHAAFKSLTDNLMTQMIYNRSEIVDLGADVEALRYIDQNPNNSTFLIDSLAHSGNGLPPKDSYEKTFESNWQLLKAIQVFSLPVLNTDIIPSNTLDIWGKPRVKITNDTIGYEKFCREMQPLLSQVRQSLMETPNNRTFSLSQHVLELAFHVRSRILTTNASDSFDTNRLRNQLKSLADEFFVVLKPLIVAYLPPFLNLMKSWIESESLSLNEELIPEPITHAFKYASHHAYWSSAFSLLRKQNSASDVLFLNGAIDFLLTKNLNITVGQTQKKTQELVDSSLWSEQYLTSLSGFTYFDLNNGTAPEDNVICLNGSCGSMNQLRKDLFQEALSTLSISTSKLAQLPHPRLFPHEVMLPDFFEESSRRDFTYVSSFMDDWLKVKLKHRNAWMSWSALRFTKLLSDTALINLPRLSNLPDSTKPIPRAQLQTNIEAWLPIMVASANMQFFSPSSNWTLITWPEMKSLEILQMASGSGVSDDSIVQKLIEFAMQSIEENSK